VNKLGLGNSITNYVEKGSKAWQRDFERKSFKR